MTRVSLGQRLLTGLRTCLALIVALFALNAGNAIAAPIIGITGTCDTFGNATFVIANTGSAMTVNYSWEIYQNATFLTSGTFMLTAAGTQSDKQQLTINGLYGTLEVRVKDQNNTLVTSASTVCVQRPTVTLNQAIGQTDPATALPILFTAVFSKAVNGFTNTDVVVSGVAGTPVVVVTDSGDHKTYAVAVSGVADLETVQLRIPQDAAVDANSLGNVASTSTDSHVTYHEPPNLVMTSSCDAHANSIFVITNTGGAMYVPFSWEVYQNGGFLTSGTFTLTAAGTASDAQQLTINGLYGNLMVAVKNNLSVQITSASAVCAEPTAIINQGAAQPDPTTASPIVFDVVFSVAVNGFTSTDVKISGMAATPGITVTDSGDHMHFTVTVTGAASGETIRATIPAGSVTDASGGHPVLASTSTDNSVTFDTSRRVTSLVVDAANSQLVTAALYGSGIWRSTNAGST